MQAKKLGPQLSETLGPHYKQYAITAKKTDSPYLGVSDGEKVGELPIGPTRQLDSGDRAKNLEFMRSLRSKKPVERHRPSPPEVAELKIPEEQLRQMNETALLHILDEYKDRHEQAEQIKKVLLERLEHFNKQSDANDKEASEKK